MNNFITKNNHINLILFILTFPIILYSYDKINPVWNLNENEFIALKSDDNKVIGIFSSKNSGESWDLVTSLDKEKLTDPESMFFLNSKLGWIGGRNWLFKSINTTDWKRVKLPQSGDVIKIQAIFDVNLYIIIRNQNSAQLWYTFDSLHWKNISPSKNVNDCFFIDPLYGFCAGDFGIYKTNNNGKSWELILKKTGLNSVYFFNKTNGIAVGDNGYIIQTYDSKNWDTTQLNDNNNLIKINFINKNEGWILSNSEMIYISNDSGKNWQKKILPEMSTGSPFFINTNKGFIGGDFLFLTENQGDNWFTRDKNYIPEIIHGENIVNNKLDDIESQESVSQTEKSTDSIKITESQDFESSVIIVKGVEVDINKLIQKRQKARRKRHKNKN